MQCPHCGKSNEDKTGKGLEVLFCMWCGKDPSADLCSGCKRDLSDLPDNILFCPTCGEDLFELKDIWTRENVTKEMLRISKGSSSMKEFLAQYLDILSGRVKGPILRTEITPFQLLTYKDDLLFTIRQFGEKGIEELNSAILKWKEELEKN